MVINIKDNGLTEKKMEKENIIGKLEMFTKESGITEKKKETEV